MACPIAHCTTQHCKLDTKHQSISPCSDKCSFMTLLTTNALKHATHAPFTQLLGEFAELCGPFSNALKSIRDELVSLFVLTRV